LPGESLAGGGEAGRAGGESGGPHDDHDDGHKTHISRIFAKTGSRDRVAAIGYARRHNLG
jgi:hypothetical protein